MSPPPRDERERPTRKVRTPPPSLQDTLMECAAAATAAAASAPSAGARYPKGSGREDGSTARRRRRLRCSGAYKMNRERSDFLASSPTRSWTMSASMTTYGVFNGS